jgi:hypothetical protein
MSESDSQIYVVDDDVSVREAVGSLTSAISASCSIARWISVENGLPLRITFMVYLPACVDHKSSEIAIDPGSRIFESRINRIE